MRLNSVVNVDKLSIITKNASLFVGVFAPYFSRNYKSYIIQYCHRLLDDYTTCDDYSNAILTLSSFCLYILYEFQNYSFLLQTFSNKSFLFAMFFNF